MYVYIKCIYILKYFIVFYLKSFKSNRFFGFEFEYLKNVSKKDIILYSYTIYIYRHVE